MDNPLSSPTYNDSLDEELIKAALQGDEQSLNDLLAKHQGFIFNISLKMLNDIPDAEDATQEILIKLATHLSSYDSSKARLRTWLYRITFNHILNVKKSDVERNEHTFPKFFEFMDSLPDVALSEEEQLYMGENVEEALISCTAGMLMCLTRDQRLTYIVGEIFKIDHHLAGEIFRITPANFRKRLSRAREDIQQWMHRKCGLVNEANPCRCRNKTKKFIELGIVDPDNRKWLSNYKSRIYELTESKMDEVGVASDQIYGKIYRDHPFKTNLTAREVLDEILNKKNFARFMRLD